MTDRRRGAHISWYTTEPTGFGHGWISGLASAILGLVGLGAVLCFHYPDLLTLPALRAYYPVPYIRAALYVVLVASFLLGVISVCLRKNKALGLVGMSLTLMAALLGGSNVPLERELTEGRSLSLDWFLLNLILYSILYIPLERFFAKYPDQPTFRPQWNLDLTYFFINTLMIQFMTLLTMRPAMVLFDWARIDAIHQVIGQIPILVQIPLILLLADFVQYWVHRAFHTQPLLWRFHAIHHSVKAMDWLAGSRLHLVDSVTTRALSYIPIYVLGFSEVALYAYVVVVVIQATFIHANVRWEFPGIRTFLVTPRYHHWHHAAEPEAINKNYAVHTTLWDWLFKTRYMPDRWPHQYGLCHTDDVPGSWLGQLAYPFRRGRKKGRVSVQK